MPTSYTTLSLADIDAEFAAMARDAQGVFGGLDGTQLNWRPDATRWSVAQCVEHLLSVNRQMFEALDAALDASRPRTVWQRMPILPGVFGSLMIRSQSPQATRKFTAPPKARPASSALDVRIVERFVASQHDAAARTRSLGAHDLSRVVMVSPFASFITYSALDGLRLVVAHQRRHFQQARRVTQAPGFPAPQATGSGV
jgi:DinB superfamily